MTIDTDCNKNFPHRSKVVINQKVFDEYCMKIKKCSLWKDTDKQNGKPVPWPSECVSNTIARMPKIKLGKKCKEIKNEMGSLDKIKTDLEDFKDLFNDISSNYIDKFSYWMGYPTDSNKREYELVENSWDSLKIDLERMRGDTEKIASAYHTRVNALDKLLKNEKLSDDDLSKQLKFEKRKLLSMGGKDQKENRYNSTSGHIIKTIYYTTAIIIMGIYLTKLN